MAHTSKLGDDYTTIGSVVVDVGGRHPNTRQPRAVPLLDVVRLQCTQTGQLTFCPTELPHWPDYYTRQAA